MEEIETGIGISTCMLMRSKEGGTKNVKLLKIVVYSLITCIHVIAKISHQSKKFE